MLRAGRLGLRALKRLGESPCRLAEDSLCLPGLFVGDAFDDDESTDVFDRTRLRSESAERSSVLLRPTTKRRTFVGERLAGDTFVLWLTAAACDAVRVAEHGGDAAAAATRGSDELFCGPGAFVVEGDCGDAGRRTSSSDGAASIRSPSAQACASGCPEGSAVAGASASLVLDVLAAKCTVRGACANCSFFGGSRVCAICNPSAVSAAVSKAAGATPGGTSSGFGTRTEDPHPMPTAQDVKIRQTKLSEPR
eukprot:4578165-Pleurochrysis_carterae.AAC.2